MFIKCCCKYVTGCPLHIDLLLEGPVFKTLAKLSYQEKYVDMQVFSCQVRFYFQRKVPSIIYHFKGEMLNFLILHRNWRSCHYRKRYYVQTKVAYDFGAQAAVVLVYIFIYYRPEIGQKLQFYTVLGPKMILTIIYCPNT